MFLRSATITVIFLTLAADPADSKPIEGKEYLMKYGYLPQPPADPGLSSTVFFDEETIQNALIDFQDFAGLPLTGTFDIATLNVMDLPRCGVRDKVFRIKRFNLQGSAWDSKNLTYRIVNYPKHLKHEQVDKVIQRAFDMWAEPTDLIFTQKKEIGKVDIILSFLNGQHGDPNPFDGPRGVLAHAAFPMQGGTVHFDAAEHWGVDSLFDIDLFQVAVHEIGHALGLDHSKVTGALMAPFYKGHDSSTKLHEDDIKGIQALYGKNTSKPNAMPTTSKPRITHKPTTSKPSTTYKPTTSKPNTHIPTTSKPSTTHKPTTSKLNITHKPTTSKPNTTHKTTTGKPSTHKSTTSKPSTTHKPTTSKPSTSHGSTAATTTITPTKPSTATKPNSSYKSTVSKPNTTHKLTTVKPKTKPKDYDLSKSSSSEELDSNEICDDLKIDTIFNSTDGQTFIFKGNKYWKLTREALTPPALISQRWPGLPSDIGAAFTHRNGRTYFFKGSEYWRYKGTKLDGKYPRKISEGFPGVPENPEAVIMWQGDGKIHFYKDDKYWKYDPELIPPVSKDYPKPVTNGISSLDFQWENGFIFFAMDKAMYEIDKGMYSVAWMEEKVPNFNSIFWIGCKPFQHDVILLPEPDISIEENIECGQAKDENFSEIDDHNVIEKDFSPVFPKRSSTGKNQDDVTVMKIPIFFARKQNAEIQPRNSFRVGNTNIMLFYVKRDNII